MYWSPANPDQLVHVLVLEGHIVTGNYVLGCHEAL